MVTVTGHVCNSKTYLTLMLLLFHLLSEHLRIVKGGPIPGIRHLTKTHNWVEWTAASVSLSQTKVNDINLNDRPQMQNDTENEIGRSLFPFIHGL